MVKIDPYQKILNILAKHFSEPDTIHKLDMIQQFADGFENWFQIETIVNLIDNEIHASTLGKNAFDADIVVEYEGVEAGLELRCWSGKGFTDNLLKALNDHPKADSYLFLFRNDDNKLSELLGYLPEKDVLYKRLDSKWIIMLVCALPRLVCGRPPD